MQAIFLRTGPAEVLRILPGVASAGILPFRWVDGMLEVLVAHPGGPFWSRREEGAWSVVKGEAEPGEDPEAAARREFQEETGWVLGDGDLLPLGEVTQRSGKRVVAWAVEADLDPATLQPGTCHITWKGRRIEVPEIDRVRWCRPEEAVRLLNPAQAPLVRRLLETVATAG